MVPDVATRGRVDLETTNSSHLSVKLTIYLHFSVAFYCNCNYLHMNATRQNYGEMSSFLVRKLLNETLTALNISSAKWYQAALICDP